MILNYFPPIVKNKNPHKTVMDAVIRVKIPIVKRQFIFGSSYHFTYGYLHSPHLFWYTDFYNPFNPHMPSYTPIEVVPVNYSNP